MEWTRERAGGRGAMASGYGWGKHLDFVGQLEKSIGML